MSRSSDVTDADVGVVAQSAQERADVEERAGYSEPVGVSAGRVVAADEQRQQQVELVQDVPTPSAEAPHAHQAAPLRTAGDRSTLECITSLEFSTSTFVLVVAENEERDGDAREEHDGQGQGHDAVG